MKPPGETKISGKGLGWNRKILLLAGLVFLLVLSILLQWDRGSPSPSSNVTRVRHSPNRPAEGGKSSNSGDPYVLLKELQHPPGSYEDGKRNLFSFYVPPPPPPPPEPEPEKVQPVCGDQVCQPGETYENCPTDCQPPPPPDIPLRYIGYMEEDHGAVAFLTDGKQVFMGRLNDIIANKYRILKISDEGVELEYLNLNQSKTIPFQGNHKS